MAQDLFKEAFKYYKSKDSAPDYSTLHRITSTNPKIDVTSLKPEFQSILTTSWDVFDISFCRGLIVIRNPFTALGQRYFIARCLQDYPLPPNPTNLTTKNVFDDVKLNWWQHVADAKVKDALRWTTLGYHHDWDTKVYHKDMKNEFPLDLKELSQEIARLLGFHEFTPEAAIVNYYPLSGTLAGHTDHSEYCKEPLFSISFGQSAIFLIGGKTKEERPEAILLESGDVLVMTEDSRESFHAVPRILSTDCEPWNAPDFQEIPEYFEQSTFEEIQHNWMGFNEYLKTSRININVRQVFKSKNKCI